MRIGIDLGGTKIEGIALANDGSIPVRHRLATPRSYEGTLDALTALVATIEREAGERCTVGIGIPGTVSAVTGVVKNANSTWLNGEPLGAALEARLARPVRLMNDANCFALSEASDGAGAGARVVFGVILGTGVGGGLVVEGTCLVGPNQIAGEWGHDPLPWMTAEEHPGPACFCGRRGCIETFLSGPGLARDHAARTGERRSAPELVVAAASGEVAPAQTMERYHDRLAGGLASVVNIVDPDVIVLGGGMSNIPELAERAEASIRRHVFSDTVATRVARNVHGDSSGVRGAAWLWPAAG